MMLKKILVVDDEPDFCEALRDLFKGKGYHVVVALSGEEALAAYRQHQPNLVILDMMMPGMSGLVTLRELKGLDPEASVVVVTALNEEGLAKQALAEGALDYITKPINSEYLELVLSTKLALIDADK
ncbi:response regulator [Nitrospinae bacterium AH_259_B05_G02_I21]|nr:response regulator [Nitrospinae bacterium AH_259_B05_G02_I21]